MFSEEGVVCFGWAILVNHYHILARFPEAPWRPMHRLNTAIARRLRCQFGGRGAVFQDRYFSSPSTDSDALLMRLAYVIANPIHHRVVDSVSALRHHPWSSLGELTGLRPAKLADPEAALALIDGPRDRAVDGLIALLEMRVRRWQEEDAAQPVERDPAIDAPLVLPAAADASPVGAAVPTDSLDPDAVVALRDRLRADGWTPAALVALACELTGASSAALRLGGRRPAMSRARAIVAYIACERLAWPPCEVARLLGLSRSSLVEARARGGAALAAVGVGVTDVLRRCGVPA